MILAPLSWLYRIFVWMDRLLTYSHRLPRPVISVGNLAMGGRAKTPFVIYLCQKLRSMGFEPVVLTRGYGRKKSREPFCWRAGERDHLEKMGDEAVEIARSGVCSAVLVGSCRAQNAKNFLKNSPAKPWVFVLDDGFQHWAIQRDVDLVIVAPEDRRDHVLPWGRLREAPSALSRADVVLELGTDLRKETVFAADLSRVQRPLILTTRAHPKSYQKMMRERFWGAEIVALRDHADAEAVIHAIRGAEASAVVLGDKEAVKVLSAEEFKVWQSSGECIKKIGARSRHLYRASLQLEWQKEHSTLQKIFDMLKTESKV